MHGQIAFDVVSYPEDAQNYPQNRFVEIGNRRGQLHFELSRWPVTVDEWLSFLVDSEYDWDKGIPQDIGRCPQTNVSWWDASAYCSWYGFRLPTAAEWECACRAGTTTEYSFGDDPKELDKYGWYDKNSQRRAHPVCKKLPNPWDMYDMHGNVWEWCDSPWSDGSSARVLRGGSRFSDAGYARSAFRSSARPALSGLHVGFRVARAVNRKP